MRELSTERLTRVRTPISQPIQAIMLLRQPERCSFKHKCVAHYCQILRNTWTKFFGCQSEIRWQTRWSTDECPSPPETTSWDGRGLRCIRTAKSQPIEGIQRILSMTRTHIKLRWHIWSRAEVPQWNRLCFGALRRTLRIVVCGNVGCLKSGNKETDNETHFYQKPYRFHNVSQN